MLSNIERQHPTQLSSTRLCYASPAVRRVARKLGVNLTQVKGSGRKNRITRDDVTNFIKNQLNKPTTEMTAGIAPAMQNIVPSISPSIAPWPTLNFEKFGTTERQKISRIRQISAANLHRNWLMIPHVTNHDDADITELDTFRKELNQQRKDSDPKITLLAFLIKTCASALKKFPEFNASLDGDELIIKHYCHIGFACNTPDGLLVPVIRNADQKGLRKIANEISALVIKAQTGKLSMAQLTGSSFSISSLGGIGGTYFTPIINAPEVAILGVGTAQTKVVWEREAAHPRLYLPLSLSWDHRAIDGAMAAKFNSHITHILSDFRRVLV